MYKDIADKWVVELRSGNYKQGYSRLRCDDRYCCLGVLCEMAVKEGIISEPNIEDYYYKYGVGFGASASTLPLAVREWSGMKSANGTIDYDLALSHENDMGMPFTDIATLIENNFAIL